MGLNDSLPQHEGLDKFLDKRMDDVEMRMK
jgi:hypothetical protein